VDFYQFDENYVRRLEAGDPAVESHFVSYFSELILIKLRRRLHSTQLINDVRQETFVRVLSALREEKRIQHPERLGAFVNSVCNNVLLESYRSRSRYEALDDLATEPAQKAIDLDGKLVNDEVKVKIQRVFARLSAKDRNLLRAVLLEEKDKDEICRELGVTKDYLRVLLYRAKQQFLTLYQKMA
jgi:RNA polymerase sigma-70 factor, ECF subfamily